MVTPPTRLSLLENCQVADYRRLREGQYTARKMTCQSVLGGRGTPPDPGSLPGESPVKNLPAAFEERAKLSSQTGSRGVACGQAICRGPPGALPHPCRPRARHGSDELFGGTGGEHSSLLGGEPPPRNTLDGRQRLAEAGQIVVDQRRKQLHQDQVRHAFSVSLWWNRELFEGSGFIF